MIFDPAPIELPASYETVPTTGHIKVSHHPAGAPSVTPVIVVTLNRPANNNAFTSQMVHDFEKFFPMFDVDERVKVIFLTGAGTPKTPTRRGWDTPSDVGMATSW